MPVIRWHIFWIWSLEGNDLIYESKQKHRQECGFYATIVRCKNMSGMEILHEDLVNGLGLSVRIQYQCNTSKLLG